MRLGTAQSRFYKWFLNFHSYRNIFIRTISEVFAGTYANAATMMAVVAAAAVATTEKEDRGFAAGGKQERGRANWKREKSEG